MNPDDPSPLHDKLSSLPREIPPARDLWPDIEAQLHSENPAAPKRADQRRSYLFIPLALAAGLAVAATLFWPRPTATREGWNVSALAGAPRVDRSSVAGPSVLGVGQWLETDAASRASVTVGSIGEIKVEPNSRLRLVNTSAQDHRIELVRGTMSALIWAPPRLFFVETPSATAVDLGCAYTLTVDDEGGSRLKVTAGYVSFEHSGRRAFIPAGLVCLTRPGIGPGTPFAENAALRDALRRFDFAAGGSAALGEILSQAALGDEITLWHLMDRVTASQRGAVFDKLAALHAPPKDVTRDGVLAGNRAMLDRWGIELGLAGVLGSD